MFLSSKLSNAFSLKNSRYQSSHKNSRYPSSHETALTTNHGLPISPMTSPPQSTRFPISLRTSYITDENATPLARLAPRRDPISKIASTLTWSPSQYAYTDGPPSPTSDSDDDFDRLLLRRLYRRTPKKCSSWVKERVRGTMSGKGTLGRGVEDVRLRQEHIEGGVEGIPMLVGGLGEETGKGWVWYVRESFLGEMRDLYTILSSVRVRKWDLEEGDVACFFEWWMWFEDLVRVYFVAMERVLGGADREEMSGILRMAERVGRMKRSLMAGGMRGRIGELGNRIDAFVMRFAGYLNSEVRRLGKGGGVGVFQSVVEEMRECGGKDFVGILARGFVGKGVGLKKRFWGKGKLLWGIVDRHSNYVRVFKKADSEYREIYRGLGGMVDEEINGVRDKYRKKVQFLAT